MVKPGLLGSAPSPRVLVVDDDELVLETMAAWLRRAGYLVTAMRDSRQAVAEFQNKHYDAVILDIFMPDKDGFETLRALREHDPAVNVLVVSGQTSTVGANYLRFAQEFGAKASLAKPFTAAALIKRLAEMLNAACSQPVGAALTAA